MRVRTMYILKCTMYIVHDDVKKNTLHAITHTQTFFSDANNFLRKKICFYVIPKLREIKKILHSRFICESILTKKNVMNANIMKTAICYLMNIIFIILYYLILNLNLITKNIIQ